MTSKIFRSTVLVAVIVLFSSLSVVMGVLYNHFTQVQIAQLKDELSLAVTGTEQYGNAFLENVEADRFRITWVDENGKVLFDTQADQLIMENHAQREEIREALETGEGSAVRTSATVTKQTHYEAQRLKDGTILRVSANQESAWSLMVGMLGPVILIAVFACGLSAFLARQMAKKIVEPLKDLDLEQPLKNDIYEEISPLLHRIHKQHNQIMTQRGNAEKMRREFSANVSHELKTPLQGIIGSAELMENELVKSEDIPRFVGHIRKEAIRLVHLIEDIIHLSQLDEGEELPTECVDMLAIAEEVKTILEKSAAGNQIKITVSGTGFKVQGVPRILQEMVYNLCDNAIKYNVSGGSVTIHLERNCLSVSDTGIGIPPEHQSRVFERFYRVDKSHSKASGGTGLGLSIVKHAAAYHNAGVSLDSVPGVGTNIRIQFGSVCE